MVGGKRKRTRNVEDLELNSTNEPTEVEEVENRSTSGTNTIARIKFNRAVNFALSSESGNVSVFLGLLEEAWKEMSSKEVEEFLDEYLEVKSILLDRLNNKESQKNSSLALQLAEMRGYERLPTFSGDFEDWIGFRDAFMLEVGGSKILEPKHKLRRLMGCLEGRARRVIGNWEYKNENYEKAWQILVTEFENQDMAISGHLNEFINIKQCAPHDSEALKELMDVAKGKQRDILSMRNMSFERFADILWRREIEGRLDEKTRAAWLMSAKKEEIATCEELYCFMAKRAKAMEASNPGHLRSELSNSVNPRNDSSRKIAPECVYCFDTGHPLAFCEEFARLSVNDRNKESSRLGCCFGCLEKGHQVWECQGEDCPRCPKIKHHSLLCYKKSKY